MVWRERKKGRKRGRERERQKEDVAAIKKTTQGYNLKTTTHHPPPISHPQLGLSGPQLLRSVVGIMERCSLSEQQLHRAEAEGGTPPRPHPHIEGTR